MFGWIGDLIVGLLKWAFTPKTEDTGVALGRTTAQKDAAEAELQRVDSAIAARDAVADDYGSLYNDRDNRSKPKDNGAKPGR